MKSYYLICQNCSAAATARFAAGAVMNAILNTDQIAEVHRLGVTPRLQELASDTAHPEVAQFAQGCLHNMRAVALRDGEQPKLQLRSLAEPTSGSDFRTPATLRRAGLGSSGSAFAEAGCCCFPRF